MSYPSFVKIVEVGPRDGLQNEKEYLSVAQKVWLINGLSDSGLSVIEVGSLVSPQWVPQMAHTGEVYGGISKRLGVHYPVLVPNKEGFEEALRLGVQEIAVFTAVSETFSRKNTNASIKESLNRFEKFVGQALDAGIQVRGYISCVMGCPYEGDVCVATTRSVARALLEMGCYEISLGDTIGVGTPLSVKNVLENLLKDAAPSRFSVHFHDTYGQALANIFQALQLGICTVDSAIGGLGGCPYATGATGNVATEDVLYMLNGMGIETGVSLEKLCEVGQALEQNLGLKNMSRAGVALAKARSPTPPPQLQ